MATRYVNGNGTSRRARGTAAAAAAAAAVETTDEDASKLLQYIKIRVANEDTYRDEYTNLLNTFEPVEKQIIGTLFEYSLDEIKIMLNNSFRPPRGFTPKIYFAHQFNTLIPQIKIIISNEAAAAAEAEADEAAEADGAAGADRAAQARPTWLSTVRGAIGSLCRIRPGGSRTNRRRRTYKVRKTKTQ